MATSRLRALIVRIGGIDLSSARGWRETFWSGDSRGRKHGGSDGISGGTRLGDCISNKKLSDDQARSGESIDFLTNTRGQEIVRATGCLRLTVLATVVVVVGNKVEVSVVVTSGGVAVEVGVTVLR